jgi:hypothetical protein
MTTRTRRPSHDDADALMPTPTLGKPIAVGATIALAGAAVWALLIVFAKYELGILAWGIGGAIGAGVVWAGGHGKPLALIAGALALLSIGSGKNFAFRALVDREITTILAGVDSAFLADRRALAAEWSALGESPTPEQVRDFAKKHDLELVTVEGFVRDDGARLRRFAAENPDLETFRSQVADEIHAELTFFDYLKNDFHVADILFAALGIATAFGLVSKATMARQMAILQELRDKANAAATTEAPPKSGQDA